jgi:RHS repeat-associated protein
VALTDAIARIRIQVKIDAWGNTTLLDPDRLGNVFSYRSAYCDPGTGLFQFGIRWYAPDLGRWMSEDPIVTITRPGTYKEHK